MKNKRSNRQIVISGILIFAVWFGALPVYAQTRQDGKGIGVKVVSELPSKEKRWALIVGIDEYQNDVSTLKGSVNDARALKNVLVSNAGFPESQIVLLTTDSAEQDKRPTRENILGALSDLYQRVPEDGLLLFSFSGHGISVGKQVFLIPSNGRFTKNPTLLEDFSIDASRIKRAIEAMKVKQVLMLLDACRNEPGRGDTPNTLTDAYKNGFSFDVANSDVKAFATLYATSIGERAYEFYDKDTKQYRGYFSYAVEEALKGKAANEKGEVTLSRLIDYLETTVPKKVKYDRGETQIPTANYSETYRANQLILAVANKPGINLLSPAQIAWNNFRGTAKKLLKYDFVDKPSEDLIIYSLKGKMGFIDKTGEIKILAKFDQAQSFSEGLAVVGNITGTAYNSDGEKVETLSYGYINKMGTTVIRLKYLYAFNFSEGLTGVVNSNKMLGFIDKNNRPIIQFKYEFDFEEHILPLCLSSSEFKNDLAPLAKMITVMGKAGEDIGVCKYGFINKAGKEIIPLEYDSVANFSEGLARVEKAGKFGFIDERGIIKIPLQFDQADSFSEGLAIVYHNYKRRLINKEGTIIITLNVNYSNIDEFSNGLAEVKVGYREEAKIGFIDKKGKELIPAKYEDVWCYGFMKEGFIGVTLNGKKGFVDIYGNEYFDF